jgi:hypothetical protein
MRPAFSWLILAGLFGVYGLGATPVALAQDVLASPPLDVSVTVYRDPDRNEGGFDLNNLNGFALITETRRVKIAPGQHRLRFEGVADGIEPASAIVTGLPSGVIEKNRDAALLSPSALIDAAEAQQGRVILARTDEATGKVTRVEGRIRSQAANGVVFETPDGVEALRCSGMPETFSFASAGTGLSAQPTLSVLTRTDKTIEAVVQISYLARGFDWAADYTASMAASPGKMDLGAWITLANGNGMSFPNARVQIVAGRLNRESGEIEPISLGQPVLAQCWPQGSTSDTPDQTYIERAFPLGFDPYSYDSRAAMAMPVPAPPPPPPPPSAPEAVMARAKSAEQEDLGDLKLYRVPDRTTVASRQSKQVRMLDQDDVPITKIHEAFYSANSTQGYAPLAIVLRTMNDKKNNLGLPLPSGRVAVFESAGSGASAQRLLAGQTNLRDLAINEETELRFPGGAAVQARQVIEARDIAPGKPLSFLPGKGDRKGASISQVSRIEISNAQPYAVQVEMRVYVFSGQEIVKADHPVAQKNGQPIFRLTVPANSDATIRYQTQASTR